MIQTHFLLRLSTAASHYRLNGAWTDELIFFSEFVLNVLKAENALHKFQAEMTK